ncbi:uncharacterized protein LOC144437295 [Glandiceps talaboti]
MDVGVRDSSGKFTESFEIFAKLPVGTLTSVIVQYETRVRDLKSMIEFTCGVPFHLQYLSYKAHYELQDRDTLRSLCLIPGVQVPVRFKHGYEDLVEAALAGNSTGVFDDIKKRFDSENIRSRKFAALFVASQRGYHFLVERLVKSDTDVNGQTSTGRTPLHIACAMGNTGCIDILLEAGGSLDIRDSYGQTPIEVASNCKQKEAERRLHLFRRTIRGPTIYRRKADKPREKTVSSWAWTPRFRAKSAPPASLMREMSLTPGPELMISRCKIEKESSGTKSVNFDASSVTSEVYNYYDFIYEDKSEMSENSSRPASDDSGDSCKENVNLTSRVTRGALSHEEWLAKKRREMRGKSRESSCSQMSSRNDEEANHAYNIWLAGKVHPKTTSTVKAEEVNTSTTNSGTMDVKDHYDMWLREKMEQKRIAETVIPPAPNVLVVGTMTIPRATPEDNKKAVQDWLRSKKAEDKQSKVYEQWQRTQLDEIEKQREVLRASSVMTREQWKEKKDREMKQKYLAEQKQYLEELKRQREQTEQRTKSGYSFEAWMELKREEVQLKGTTNSEDKIRKKQIRKEKQQLAQQSFEKWMMDKEWEELCRLKEKPLRDRPKTTHRLPNKKMH